MRAIASWTGARTDALRQVMRMSNRSFAQYPGVSVRTVANWREWPDMIPQPDKQAILDTAIDRAPDRVKAQFASLAREAVRTCIQLRRRNRN
jgi:DNA-binding transcriptional regulator YiaG